jgi:hypothetical protein
MPAAEHGDRGVAGEQPRVVEPHEPALRVGDPHRRAPRKRCDAHELRHPRRVPGCVGVVDRGLELAVRSTPVGRPAVELAHQSRLLARELREQQLAEQVVEAEPFSTVVERHEEEIRLLDRLQPACGVAALQHRVAERRGHPLEHRAAGEEPQLLRGQAGEMLDLQIVGDETVVSAERPR